MIPCELLAYVSTYRRRSTEYNLKLAILQHYSYEKILEARSTMEENVKTLIPAYPHLGKKRTDSTNRTASEAMISDILEMFKWLENTEDSSTIPVFVAVDVSKLPAASPESAADMMSVMETLAAQQRQLHQMQETMTKIRSDVDENRVQIQTQSSSSSKQGVPSTPSQARATAIPASEKVQTPSNIQDKGTAGSSGGEKVKTLYLDKVKANPVPMQGTDGFQKGGKRPNKGSSSAKPQRVSGTSDSTLLRAGPTTVQLQITNVSKELTEQDIKDYITAANGGSVQVQSVEDRTSDGWETKRFVLTFEAKYSDTVLSQDFWPKKIYFKRWFPSRPQRNSGGSKL